MSENVSPAQKEQLEDMLGLLAHIRIRPGMWIGSKDEYALRAFTTGFSLAASLLGVHLVKTQEEVWQERGWIREGSMDYIHLLKESGMSNDEIALENFTVMMVYIKRHYQLTGETVLETHNQMRQQYMDKGHEVSMDLARQMESLEKDLGISRNQ